MSDTPPQAPVISWAHFVTWAGAFALLTVIALGASESDQYGELASALVWVAALGATVYWWDSLDAGLAELVGAKPPADTTTAGYHPGGL